MFAVLCEISSELYYRSTPHHDAVRGKNPSWTDRWSAVFPCIGLTFLVWLPTRLITKRHLACRAYHDAVRWPDWTSLFVDVGFSISQLALIVSPAPWLLSVTSSDAFVQWSLGPHSQGLQIDSGKSDAVRAHETTWTILPTAFGVQFQSRVLLCQIG